MTDYHDVGADTCASQPGQWRVMWRFLGMLFYGGIFMTRFLIRFLGGFFAFVGLGALADSAVANGICDGVKLHLVSNGNVGKTAGVVSYTNESGAGWFVGWPNSGYSEVEYGPRPALWYDMDGYDAFFDGSDFYYNQLWRFPSRVGPAADSKLQEGCILAPDVDRVCTSYYSGVTVAGYFCAGCAIPIDATGDTMPGVLFAEVSGLFKDYGCCQYGETGSGISQCPCFFASTLSGVTVTDMNGEEHTAPNVTPQIYIYNFLNCQADAYQEVDSDGYSYVLPWVSAEDASGAGTGMLKGRVKFVYQPGFWSAGQVGSTDQLHSDSCTFSDVHLDGPYGVSGSNRCATSGCADITQSSGFWFNPSQCDSCRTLPDDVYSGMSAEMVFKPTVSTIGAGAFLRSTFGPESCYLEKIGPFEDTNGSYEYSCDSYYTE